MFLHIMSKQYCLDQASFFGFPVATQINADIWLLRSRQPAATCSQFAYSAHNSVWSFISLQSVPLRSHHCSKFIPWTLPSWQKMHRRIQQPQPGTLGQTLSLFDKCPGFFYVRYTTHMTNSFTSHPKEEAVVKCLVDQKHQSLNSVLLTAWPLLLT